MSSLRHPGPLKYLGSLRGSGSLAIDGGLPELGDVVYEIEGFVDRTHRTATGRIEGDAGALTLAFQAGRARLTLARGLGPVEIVLLDPQGGQSAEVTVSGPFPL